MSKTVQFSKAVIPSFTRSTTGGTAKVVASFTKPPCEAMEWGEPSDWGKSCNLVGELKSSIVDLEPYDSDLAKFRFELRPAPAVYGFSLLRVQVKKGKTANKNPTFRTELHFSIDFTDPKGAEFLERYILSVGESRITVTYEPEAKQGELPGVEAKEPAQGKLEELVEDVRKKRSGKDD